MRNRRNLCLDDVFLISVILIVLFAFISLPSFSETLPSADVVGIPAVRAWASDRIENAKIEFISTGLSRKQSPDSWSDQVVYEIFVDRFNNGDPTNDNLLITEEQLKNRSGSQVGLNGYRHGGDLKGIIDRLDYIKDLGVTALWITPVFKGDGTYHGYCTNDITQVDPNFGDNEKLRELVSQAHRRGILVVLDIVANHLCSKDYAYDDIATPFSYDNYSTCVNDFESKEWLGTTLIRGQRKLNFGATSFPPFRSPNFFVRCGYHAGDLATEGAGARWGDFAKTMFDLDTLNFDLQDIFVNLQKWWIAYADIDGIRIDAAKHVNADFIAHLSTDLRDYAKSLGKDNFFVIGEVVASSYEQSLRTGYMRSDVNHPENSVGVPYMLKERLPNLKEQYLSHPHWPLPGQNAVYDVTHSGIATDAFHNLNGRSPLTIKQWYFTGSATDNSNFSPAFNDLRVNGDPLLNWNMFEIHDWPRFAMTNNNPTQLKGAIGYFLTAMGMPVLYYGVEQGFNGLCPLSNINVPSSDALTQLTSVCNSFNDSRYRQDMFIHGPWRLGSLVPSVNNLAEIGFDNKPMPVSWQVDPFLSRDHDIYKWTRKLINVRNSCAPLRRGSLLFRQASNISDGLIAYSRIYDNEEMLVVQNVGPTERKLTQLSIDSVINSDRSGTVFQNLLNDVQRGRVTNVGGASSLMFFTKTAGADGDLIIGPYETLIFSHESKVGKKDANLETNLCGANNKLPIANAGADQIVSGSVNVFLNGSASTDPDGNIVSYQWTQIAGPQVSIQDANKANAQFILPAPSFSDVVFTFKLTITDDQNATNSAITNVQQTGEGFLHSYPQVYFRGTPNNWLNNIKMTLVGNYLWESTQEFGSSSNERFKFDINGNWLLNFGDSNRDGVANQNGADIFITQGAGKYTIRFNDQTLAYTITPLFQTQIRRTVVYVYGQTVMGQDMFLRGGIDWEYSKNILNIDCTINKWLCAILIQHNVFKDEINRTNDKYLDWYGAEVGQTIGIQGSPLVWTTNSWPVSWGAKKTVAINGYGEDPENQWGPHYWKLDMQMDCSKTVNGWFELKSFISNGPGWEVLNAAQVGRPYTGSVNNHFAKCGMLNKFERGSNSALIQPLM